MPSSGSICATCVPQHIATRGWPVEKGYARVTTVSQLDDTTQAEALRRLRRIEGQARGLQRMITQGRDCREIIQQLTALRGASHAVSVRLFEVYAARCLHEAATSEERLLALAQLVSMIARLAT